MCSGAVSLPADHATNPNVFVPCPDGLSWSSNHVASVLYVRDCYKDAFKAAFPAMVQGDEDPASDLLEDDESGEVKNNFFKPDPDCVATPRDAAGGRFSSEAAVSSSGAPSSSDASSASASEVPLLSSQGTGLIVKKERLFVKGTPGIGKSFFAWYCLLRLLRHFGVDNDRSARETPRSAAQHFSVLYISQSDGVFFLHSRGFAFYDVKNVPGRVVDYLLVDIGKTFNGLVGALRSVRWRAALFIASYRSEIAAADILKELPGYQSIGLCLFGASRR